MRAPIIVTGVRSPRIWLNEQNWPTQRCSIAPAVGTIAQQMLSESIASSRARSRSARMCAKAAISWM